MKARTEKLNKLIKKVKSNVSYSKLFLALAKAPFKT